MRRENSNIKAGKYIKLLGGGMASGNAGYREGGKRIVKKTAKGRTI